MKAAGRDNQVRLAVSGTGIEPAISRQMFEGFVSGRPGGMRLELTIDRAITADHGGTLEGATRFEGGARFVVSFPV